MTNIPEHQKTLKMRKGTTLWYRLGITEDVLMIFWREVGEQKKRPDSMFDTVSMMDVPIQQFWGRLQDQNKKLGKPGVSNIRKGMTKGLILQQNKFF